MPKSQGYKITRKLKKKFQAIHIYEYSAERKLFFVSIIVLYANPSNSNSFNNFQIFRLFRVWVAAKVTAQFPPPKCSSEPSIQLHSGQHEQSPVGNGAVPSIGRHN
jgi:hypothetical protein